jgi:hypothetical protein
MVLIQIQRDGAADDYHCLSNANVRGTECSQSLGASLLLDFGIHREIQTYSLLDCTNYRRRLHYRSAQA